MRRSDPGTTVRFRRVVALGLLLIAAGIGTLAAQSIGVRYEAPADGLDLLGWPGDGAGFAGAAACAGCHGGLAENAHPMARSGAAVTPDARERFFSAERLALPVRWRSASTESERPRYSSVAQGVVLRRGEGEAELAAHAVFGSGLRGETPVHFAPAGGLRELRVSWSAGIGTWIETPGSENDRDLLGDLDSPEMAADCIGCHATAVRWEGGSPVVEESEWGVRCERCHGPGAAHASGWEEGTGGAVFNPGALEPAEQVVFCGQCHRLPSDIEPLDVLRRDTGLVRHAGASLMMSACFRESPPESAVSCLSCHDPHLAEPTEVVAERSRATCLGCHADPAAAHRYERVSRDSDCLACHLPRVEEVFPGAGFTDHWIRVRGGSPAPGSPEWEAEIAWLELLTRNALSEPQRPRKEARLAIGLAELLQAQGLGESALVAIRRALDRDPDYGQLLKAAAILRQTGEEGLAAGALERAAAMDPETAQAWFDLGDLRLARGDSTGGVAALERARALQPQSAVVLSRLGAAYRQSADLEAALETGLEAVAVLDGGADGPEALEAWLELGITRRARRETSESAEALRNAHEMASDWPPALDALARLLALDPDASVRDVPEAVRLAERLAGFSGYQEPLALDLLAAVHAAAGDFQMAVRAMERALEGLDASDAEGALGEAMRARLALYRAGRPWMEEGVVGRVR